LACRAGLLDYFVDLLLKKSLIALNLKAVSLISMDNGLPIVRLAGGTVSLWSHCPSLLTGKFTGVFN
jgi:hypothetical protein